MKLVQKSTWMVALMTAAATSHGQAGQNQPRERQPYSIEQAISDDAQLHTIAFNGLAFITGDFGASTFIPPGKVCDYFGFQYMRDIDSAQKGHNPMFLNRVAGNVIKTLNDEQKAEFLKLAEEQVPQYEKLAQLRLPLIKAFTLELEGKAPARSAGLNRDAVKQYVGNLFTLDGEMCYRRAEVMGKVARSLTAEQKSFLGSMKFGDFASWPDVDQKEQMRSIGRGKSKMFNVAFMTYVSEFYSWYAGSLKADTYFCPERHGTYFGGFYMKDMPAMGKHDYDISLNITGDSGKEFLNALTPDQRITITGIISAQRALIQETVKVREKISVELRKFLAGETANKATVLSLSKRYGELDGEMSWMYATAFAKVNKTLDADQKAKLMKLRNLEGYTSAPYYLYSSAVKEQPKLEGVDAFFSQPSTHQETEH